jgi:hypothetical protein
MRIIALILAFALATPALAVPPAEEAAELIEAGDLASAERLIESGLESGSRSSELLYQFARIKALQGDKEKAAAGLVAAVAAGFTDFFRLVRDPALEPIRETPAHRTIAQNRATLLEDRAKADFKAVRRALPRYTLLRDEDLRLQFAAAHDRATLERVVAEAKDLRDWLRPVLGEPPADPELDPWVTVLLPSPEDFVRLIGGANVGTVGGYYDPETRRVVSADLGPSLRHELVHVFHFRRLERLGASRPHWWTEGLATLPEALDPRAREIRPVACWRTDIARRRLAAGRLRDWPDLFEQSRDRFIGHRPKAQYAQSRAIAMFLHAEGLLADVARAIESAETTDPDGRAVIARAAGREAHSVERTFRGWLATLGEGDPDEVDATRAIGLILTPGRGDGPVIDHVEMRSVARDARLRRRDVIIGVGDRPVRTIPEVLRAVRAFHATGEPAEVTIRRGSLEKTCALDPPR